MGAQASTQAITKGDKPRVALRGFERWATMTDYGSSKIVHVMRVQTTDPKKLLEHVPAATMRTFNKHPRMRALQVRGKFATVEIQPPFASVESFLAAQTQRPLLEVEEKPKAEMQKHWASFALSECEVPFDRYAQRPFHVTVWGDEASGEARLMLFSDHYQSDGISGMVILNDILEQTTLLARSGSEGAVAPPTPMPLVPSMYNNLVDSKPVKKVLSEWLVALTKTTLLNKFGQKGGYYPVIPIRSDQHDFTVPPKVNPCYGFFDEGTPEALKRALAATKRESTSYAGALVAAVFASYYRTAKYAGSLTEETKDVFKMVVSANYNMRPHVPVDVPADHVGCFMTVLNLERLAKDGVDVSKVKFWDLARLSKKDLDAVIGAPANALMEIFLDQALNSNIQPETFKDIPIEKSYTTDANISSVGRYTFQKEHRLHEGDADPWLRVEAVHMYATSPHLAGNMVFVTSADAANYAMMCKFEDDVAAVAFTSIVDIGETLGEIPSDATVLDVVRMLDEQ